MSNWLKNLISPAEQTALGVEPNNPNKSLPMQLDPVKESVIYKEQGDAHLRNGNLEDAKACYQHAIALNPNYAKAHSNLGFVLKEQNLYGDAERCLKTALSIDPKIADTHYMLGTISQLHGKLEDAIHHFRKALKLDPELEFAYRDLCYVLFQHGQIDEAKAVINKGITNNPGIADYHFYLGNLYTHTKELDKAVACYRTALSIQPAYVEAHYNLGIVLQEQGNLSEAIASYRKAISLKPDYAEAHFNLGNTLHDLGRLNEAETSFRQTLEIKPDSAEAHSNLGLILQNQGRLTEAEASYRLALGIKPDYTEAHLSLGNVLKDMGRLDEAEASYRQALQIMPDYAEAHSNLGLTLQELGRLDEAEASYRRALQIKPNYADAHYNLGLTLQELGRLDEAETSYRRALQIKTDFAEAHNNLGIALKDMGRLDEAEASCRRALQIKPDFAAAHSNLGNVLHEIGQSDDAVDSYRRALQIKPDYAEAHSNLIFALDLMADEDTSSLQKERKRWDAAHAAPLHQRHTHTNIPDPERRMRIGYVSADLREHSAPKVFGGMLTRYDRSQFDVFAYSNLKGRDDRFTDLFKQNVTAWRNIRSLSDDTVAKMIREDQIDILVDLSGHTGGNRLLVFARKPAPIQITAWGYATGTGMRAMDVFFADPVLVPPEDKQYFSEKIRYLPSAVGAFFTEPFPDVNELPALSGGILTFGSLNRLVKVSDNAYRAWAKVLMAVPRSRLILKAGELNDASARERVAGHFTKAGVAADRIIMQGKTSWYEHMETYNQIDFALDPFPHGGGVTTLEGLMMGVPVINLRWPTMVGSVSASIMTTLGLTDWIAETQEKYVELAIQKAGDLQPLAALRLQLRGIFTSSVMGDPAAYARAVEQEYRQLWREWCARQ